MPQDSPSIVAKHPPEHDPASEAESHVTACTSFLRKLDVIVAGFCRTPGTTVAELPACIATRAHAAQNQILKKSIEGARAKQTKVEAVLGSFRERCNSGLAPIHARIDYGWETRTIAGKVCCDVWDRTANPVDHGYVLPQSNCNYLNIKSSDAESPGQPALYLYGADLG